MRMAKVNPLNAKYCVDFTLAKRPPHLIATNLVKMDPLKLKPLFKRHGNSKSQVRIRKFYKKIRQPSYRLPYRKLVLSCLLKCMYNI